MFVDRGGYSCSVRGCDGPYEGDPFDYMAAYVFQEDWWYFIPAEMVVGQGSIALYPQIKRSKYEPYRGAWHLLRRQSGRTIHACVDEEWGSTLREKLFFFVENIRVALGLAPDVGDGECPERDQVDAGHQLDEE